MHAAPGAWLQMSMAHLEVGALDASDHVGCDAAHELKRGGVESGLHEGASGVKVGGATPTVHRAQ